MDIKLKKIWGETIAFIEGTRKFGWVDVVIIFSIGGVLYWITIVASEWTDVIRPKVAIELTPWALPQYTFFSMCRGLIAYFFSLIFTIVYGYWAAKDKIAERILIPLLDILQSIPVLGFMPGIVLALISIFPRSNIGLELASIIMIFTGQVWNMTFSFYHSIKSIPQNLKEVAVNYNFSWWERFKWLELPSSTMGLVWNSMMSMAGGWFFLMISESFVLGDKDFRLPGIGSFLSVAVEQGNIPAIIWAVFAMISMIIILDQILWRPVVVWAQKFRMEEGVGGEVMTSWFLDFLRRSHIFKYIDNVIEKRIKNIDRDISTNKINISKKKLKILKDNSINIKHIISWIFFFIIICGMLIFSFKLINLFKQLNIHIWGNIILSSFFTMGRVLSAVALGTLWTIPVGLMIGLSPRLSKICQPIVQIAASFPAPMLFPLVVWLLLSIGININIGSVILMLLGTQWYILFNVIAGAIAIPSDLKEGAGSFNIKGRQLFFNLYLPAIFPYLVTGWVSAAGGAWNASIVSEYVTFKNSILNARGVGAIISEAAKDANFPILAGSIAIMSIIVVLFNRIVWRNFYKIAQNRYSLNR